MPAPEEAGPERALPDALAERLDGRPWVEGAEVVAWRFDLSTGWALQAGLKEGRLGGPYEPPAAARGTGGRLYLRWSDGACSHGTLDAHTLEDWAERLAEWRAAAYLDPDAPDVLPPPTEPLPAVRTADPSVEALVDGRPEPLIVVLDGARLRLGAAGIGHVRADSGAGQGWRHVFSSRGLRVSYPETAASLYLAAEERYWRSYGRRRWPSEAELDELFEDVIETTLMLRTTASPPLGELPVLLRPGVASKLLATFLVANLGGSAVANGRSAFSLDDFRDRRQILREDLDLVVDSLLDLEGAAAPISAEGIPGGRATLVEGGRLSRPMVDLKYAARTGFAPTPVPAGAPSFLLRGRRPPRPVAEVRAALPLAVEAHALLGLSSQDPVRDRYALVAAHALVVLDGRPVGRAKLGLSGGLLDQLRDPRTELVAYPWRLSPGLLVWGSVSPRG